MTRVFRDTLKQEVIRTPLQKVVVGVPVYSRKWRLCSSILIILAITVYLIPISIL